MLCRRLVAATHAFNLPLVTADLALVLDFVQHIHFAYGATDKQPARFPVLAAPTLPGESKTWDAD